MLPIKKKFQGDRLRLIRMFHGYTLADLGERVTASRQYIQKIEQDLGAPPSTEMINVLAQVLNVRPEFFAQNVSGFLQEESCFFRKQKTTPKKIWKRAISYGTIFNSIINFIDERFYLPQHKLPSLEVNGSESTERAAERCRVELGLGLDTPLTNMTRVIENNGGIVATFEGVSNQIDAFSYNYNRPIVIRNTSKNSRSRARFDIAHELGHIILHHGIEPGIENDNENSGLEPEADQFASSFLLPRSAFYREFKKPLYNRFDWQNLIQMKGRWGVSLQALIRRAYDLGIIDSSMYRSAHITISKKGWRSNEPGEELIEEESAELVNDTIAQLKLGGYSINAIAESLCLDPSILSEFGINQDESLSCELPNHNNVISFSMAKSQNKKTN